MNTSLKYGITGGGILSVIDIIFYSLNIESKLLYSIWIISQLAVIVFAIYWGVKEAKRIRFQNSISYRDAVFTALKINFLACVISSASIFLFIYSNQNVFNKLVEDNISQTVSQMKELGYADALIKDRVKSIRENITPSVLAFYPSWNNFKGILFLGLVISLIVTAILRSEVSAIPEIKQN